MHHTRGWVLDSADVSCGATRVAVGARCRVQGCSQIRAVLCRSSAQYCVFQGFGAACVRADVRACLATLALT